MNDKQRQIEEMAQAIFDYVDTKNMRSVYICGNKTIDEAKPFLHNTGVAEFMYEKGYRKQSDTAREILLLLGRGFDEVTGKDFKDLSWYKFFCRELKRRYGVEVEE